MTNEQILSRVKTWKAIHKNAFEAHECANDKADAETCAALEKILADYEAIQKRFDEFANGVRQLIFDLSDKPRGTRG